MGEESAYVLYYYMGRRYTTSAMDRKLIMRDEKGRFIKGHAAIWAEELSRKLTGRKLTEEVRNKMSLSQKGKVRSDEAKENYRLSQLGIKNSRWAGGKGVRPCDSPESEAIYRNRRRAFKQNTVSKITTAEWIEIRDRYKKCLACGDKEAKLTIDHIIPLCKGGEDTKENIQPLCMLCNLKKARKIIDYRIEYIIDTKNNENYHLSI